MPPLFAIETASIGQSGVDLLVDQVHQQFSALRLGRFHLISGHAKLIKDDQDGLDVRIVDGTWADELDLGVRHTPSTFAGTR